MMMAAAKKIERDTSADAERMAWLFIPIVVSKEMWLRSASDSARGLRQPAEDRLHHDDGGVDDQAEIDRADRQQIGGFAAQHQDDHGEEQRERDRRADDQRAAEVAEEYPLQQHDQEDPDHHVVQHGVGGDVDQVLAVVDPLDAARRAAGSLELLMEATELLDAGDGRRTLLAAPHQHDALHDVVVLVEAGDAEPRLLADGDGARCP